MRIQRGNHNGIFSNAKPIFMLAIINSIEKQNLKENHIILDELLVLEYKTLSKYYEPDKVITPIVKPYFHLSAEPFYEIKYKEGITTPKHSVTLSLKKLRNIVDDVKLDDGLWELLQEENIRQEYSETIITHFLNK